MELIELVKKDTNIDRFRSLLEKQDVEVQKSWLMQKYHNGMNVMHVCCSQGYTAHVNVLIKAAEKHFMVKEYLDQFTGFDVPQEGQVESQLKDNGAKQVRMTALFYAIRSGHGGFLEIINILVKNGCDVNAQDQDGKTPLHYASELGQDDTLEILLNNKANPDIQEKLMGKTPLHEAIENGQFNSVQILCDLGSADVHI